MQYPQSMQPTHARWEAVHDDVEAATSSMRTLMTSAHTPSHSADTIFPPVPAVVARNFLVVDTVYESAPHSHLGIPGPDGEEMDIGYNGLSGVGEEIRELLPAECRRAFEEAVERERRWKGRWGTEERDGARRAPIIDKGMIL